jgi:hypothetical protein
MKNLITNFGDNVALTFNNNVFEVYCKQNLDDKFYNVTYCATLAEAIEECNKKYLELIIWNASKNKGITYDLNHNTFNPNYGYSVSMKGCEVKSLVLTARLLADYIKMHSYLLSQDNNFLGIWADGGKWYLDVTNVVLDKQDAIKLGIANEQLAIFDNKNKVAINIK